ncbi:MAG: hypothetical protein GY856_05485 [bacterium]|nr:hypothetical protein [bacterium]
MRANRSPITAIIITVAVAAAVGQILWLRRAEELPAEPHYLRLELPDALLWAPADRAELAGSELRIAGGERIVIWLESSQPLSSAVFAVGNPADHEIAVGFGNARSAITFDQVAPNEAARRLLLQPQRPDRVRRRPQGVSSLYRLEVRVADRGQNPAGDELGVALRFLGTREYLERDIYSLAWGGCGAPSPVTAGEEFLAMARLRNLSEHPWRHRGEARVELSYHWLNRDGDEVVHDGVRTQLQAAVEPGAELVRWQRVRAPLQPGPYLLELDPIFEHVAWFSTRNGGTTCRAEVEVTAPRVQAGDGS